MVNQMVETKDFSSAEWMVLKSVFCTVVWWGTLLVAYMAVTMVVVTDSFQAGEQVAIQVVQLADQLVTFEVDVWDADWESKMVEMMAWTSADEKDVLWVLSEGCGWDLQLVRAQADRLDLALEYMQAYRSKTFDNLIKLLVINK